MEKLSIEEKAKAYDEALERVEKIRTGKYETTFIFTEGLFEHIFPELKESEDERIRKAIVLFFETQDESTTYSFVRRNDILAWLEKHKYTEEDLDKAYKCADEVQYRRGYEDAKKEIEKQGEQKPVDKVEQEYHCNGVREPKEATGVLKQLLNKENYAWSEGDKVKINRIVTFLENLNLKYLNAAGNDILLKDIEWLKSLKDRVQPQPKQEWSKYDDDTLIWICKIIFSTRQRGGITQQEEKELGDWIDKWLNHKPITLDNEFEQHVDSLLKRLGGVCRCELVRTRFAISEDEEWLKSLKFKCNIVKGISKHKLLKKIQELEDKNNCGTYDFIESKRIAFEQVKEVIEKL